jgi:hypothetical protein
VAIYERNLRSIAALAEANGAAMMLTTMPALQGSRPGIPAVPDGHLKSLAAQNERLRALAAREEWMLTDLADLAEKLTPYYEDAIHVDVRGERLKAKAIATQLETNGVFGSVPTPEVKPTAEPQ